MLFSSGDFLLYVVPVVSNLHDNNCVETLFSVKVKEVGETCMRLAKRLERDSDLPSTHERNTGKTRAT